MIALCVLAAVAAPLDLGGASTCRLVSQIRIKGQNIACCESCLAPYLLDTKWVTVSTEDKGTYVSADKNTEQLETDDGSGYHQFISAADSKETVAAVSLRDTQTAPCGTCVTTEQCLRESLGFVNTWHRLCQRTQS